MSSTEAVTTSWGNLAEVGRGRGIVRRPPSIPKSFPTTSEGLGLFGESRSLETLLGVLQGVEILPNGAILHEGGLILPNGVEILALSPEDLQKKYQMRSLDEIMKEGDFPSWALTWFISHPTSPLVLTCMGMMATYDFLKAKLASFSSGEDVTLEEAQGMSLAEVSSTLDSTLRIALSVSLVTGDVTGGPGGIKHIVEGDPPTPPDGNRNSPEGGNNHGNIFSKIAQRLTPIIASLPLILSDKDKLSQEAPGCTGQGQFIQSSPNPEAAPTATVQTTQEPIVNPPQDQDPVHFTEELLKENFDTFNSFPYSGRIWTIVPNSREIASNKQDGTITIAHPQDITSKKVDDTRDIGLASKVTFQAQEGENGTATLTAKELLVEDQDHMVYPYVLLRDRNNSKKISENEVEIHYQPAHLTESGELREIPGARYIERIVKDREGNITLKEVTLVDPELGFNFNIVEENGHDEPTTQVTPPASFIEEVDLENFLSGDAGEIQLFPPPPLQPENVIKVVSLQGWNIGIDKDNNPIAILEDGGKNWIPVPQDQLSQLPSWSQSELVLSDDGVLRYIDVNGKPLYALKDGKWVEEKGPYYECGVGWDGAKDLGYPGLIAPDGKKLPSGITGYENKFGGLQYYSAIGCILEELQPVPKENYGVGELFQTRIGFYDNEGNLYPIPAIIGGDADVFDFRQDGVFDTSVCINGYCEIIPVQQAVQKINEMFSSGSNFQVEIDLVTNQDNNSLPLWSLSEHINNFSETHHQLKQAIEKRSGFPNLPDGFFVYITIIRANP